MRLFLLFLLPFLVSQTALAQSWRLAAYSNDPTKLAYLVDVDSIERSGNKVTFRQQSIYESVSETRDFDRSVLKREVDCTAYTTFMRSSEFYVAGKYLDTEEGPSSTTTAAAGSIMRRTIDSVCGREDYLSPILDSPESWVRGKFRSGF